MKRLLLALGALVAAVVVGGLGSLAGVVFGAVLIVIMFLIPGGVAGLLRRLEGLLRPRPAEEPVAAKR